MCKDTHKKSKEKEMLLVFFMLLCSCLAIQGADDNKESVAEKVGNDLSKWGQRLASDGSTYVTTAKISHDKYLILFFNEKEGEFEIEKLTYEGRSKLPLTSSEGRRHSRGSAHSLTMHTESSDDLSANEIEELAYEGRSKFSESRRYPRHFVQGSAIFSESLDDLLVKKRKLLYQSREVYRKNREDMFHRLIGTEGCAVLTDIDNNLSEKNFFDGCTEIPKEDFLELLD